jgi:hypothetical protein
MTLMLDNQSPQMLLGILTSASPVEKGAKDLDSTVMTALRRRDEA